MTNSERRVQRVRKALEPPGEAQDDMWILAAARAAPRPRLARPGRRGGVGRAALALADARRDELRPARGARRAAVAVPGRGAPRLAVPARAALGRPAGRPARAVLRRRGAGPVRGARRRVPDPAHDRPAARVVQHRRADEPLPLAAPPRRVARPLARGRRAARARRRRDRARLLTAWLRRGAGADRPVAAARGSRS